MTAPEPGKLIVISGPSGVGKSTVVAEVLKRCGSRLRLSISATTREPRPNERDGADYHFLSNAEFASRREEGAFLECVEVFGQGHWYGTLWSEVRPSLEAGKWVLLEIDVNGAKDVFGRIAGAVSIFLQPGSSGTGSLGTGSLGKWGGSLEELERRLRSRGTEEEEAIQRRLRVAKRELELAEHYEYQVVNDTVAEAVDQICQILQDRGLPQ